MYDQAFILLMNMLISFIVLELFPLLTTVRQMCWRCAGLLGASLQAFFFFSFGCLMDYFSQNYYF